MTHSTKSKSPAKTKLTPPLKWYGGKTYLAGEILELMPKHTHYVETHFGGGAALLAKDPRGVSEVVNDINGELTNFWHVLQHPRKFEVFQRTVAAIPFSQKEWNDAVERDGRNGITRAVKFFIRCRQSRAGQFDNFAPLSRSRTRRGMNEQASAWLNAVEGLPAVHARLQRVVILNDDASVVICKEDSPNTLFYCDPPYPHETRTAKDVYAYEMSDDDHRGLLDVLKAVKGKVMLSGYRNDLYDRMLADWNRKDFAKPNNAAGGKKKRTMTECLWMNY